MENDRYADGFNDSLMLIRMADDLASWDEALKSFDLKGVALIDPMKTNLEKVKDIWDVLTC